MYCPETGVAQAHGQGFHWFDLYIYCVSSETHSETGSLNLLYRPLPTLVAMVGEKKDVHVQYLILRKRVGISL